MIGDFNLDLRDPNNPSNPIGPRAGLDEFGTSNTALLVTTSGWVINNAPMDTYIQNMPYLNQDTNTHAGLYEAQQFINTYGVRTGAYVVIFIATDGQWNMGPNPKYIAHQINSTPRKYPFFFNFFD